MAETTRLARGRTLTRGRAATLGCAAVVVILAWTVLPSAASAGTITIVTSWLITSQLVLSVDIVYASVRQMSLVHVALWGIGAYFMLGLQTHDNWSFWPALGVSILATVACAAVISLVVFRTSGYYFAILTFVVGQTINLCFSNMSVTGGTTGLFYLTHATILGLPLSTANGMFRVTLAATVIVLVGTWLLRRSSFARKANAVGDNADLATAYGLRPANYRRLMFVASAVVAGIAGALYATSVGAIEPALFDAPVSIAVILMALLGGSGSLLGPLVGGAIYVVLPQVLPLNATVATGIVGVLFIALIRLTPNGLVPAASDLLHRRTSADGPGATSLPTSTPPPGASTPAPPSAAASERLDVG
jgi:branched-chain amino acid transport system permease protein